MDNLVIEEQIKGLTFADDRLRQRYELCLSRIQPKDWNQSFPSLIKVSYALKGFYRFINNSRVTQATFIEGYRRGLAFYSLSPFSFFLMGVYRYSKQSMRFRDNSPTTIWVRLIIQPFDNKIKSVA